MLGFATSHAGRGTLALGLMALLIVWPPMLAWLAAIFTLAYAIHHLRESFRIVEAEEPTA